MYSFFHFLQGFYGFEKVTLSFFTQRNCIIGFQCRAQSLHDKFEKNTQAEWNILNFQ